MRRSIKIACTKDNLKEIRDFVTTSLQSLCISELEINMMVLAVDEICANRIIHSNKCDANLQLELIIKDEDQGVSFEIVDQGEPFEPSGHEDPDIKALVKEKKKGGLGLMLVKKIMDSIEVKSENQFTTYKLFKKVNFC